MRKGQRVRYEQICVDTAIYFPATVLRVTPTAVMIRFDDDPRDHWVNRARIVEASPAE